MDIPLWVLEEKQGINKDIGWKRAEQKEIWSLMAQEKKQKKCPPSPPLQKLLLCSIGTVDGHDDPYSQDCVRGGILKK